MEDGGSKMPQNVGYPYQATWCQNPEDNMNHENLKSSTVCISCIISSQQHDKCLMEEWVL
jgi:hypothetical protein